ncbi:hypothetical protein K2O51_23335 [Cupriavidus pinatubonensis]|uniref:hypothetical protein n=1 Tax=Cupriavidus pinatubonensis TaxID=248026 RepID=UPI001C731F09|nr:hypothetical protein [Cupriavidus pinatubonensis]QYY30306.1 hypothetical protein K2O51_23335 [Cupriavidus pinatubonensis]
MTMKIRAAGGTIKEKVKVERRNDFGKIETFEFTGIFRRLDRHERSALFNAHKDYVDALPETMNELDKASAAADDYVKRWMVGFEDVVDEAGNAFQFSPENLLVLIADPEVLAGVRLAIDRVAEIKALRTKN